MIRIVDILKKQNRYSNYINSVLKDNGIDINFLENIYSDVKIDRMYAKDFHGLNHSEKVCLYALILAKKYHLNEIELQIIKDAALNHDIGRINDFEDSTHGIASARQIAEVIDMNNKAYQDSDNLIYLKAIVEAHSLPPKDKKFIFDNYAYEFPSLKYEKYERLYNILLDADALDRTRFRKTSTAALNEHYLRLPESKQLIEFANILNEYYRFVADQLSFENFSKLYNPNDPTKNPEGCFHGISNNFFALEGILENGILSEYAMQELGISSSRNFFGNNRSMFISVVDDESYSKDEKANNKFLKQSVSLYCLVTNLCSGKSQTDNSTSANNLPVNSWEYTDEKFAFYKILPEQIFSIVVPKNIINKDIKTLNYMVGSLNYDAVVGKVNNYLEKLNQVNIKNFNDNLLNNLLLKYKDEVVSFEKLDIDKQKSDFDNYCERLEDIVTLINGEIQKIANLIWHIEMGKNLETIITISDVVSHILQKYNKNYELQDTGEELLYVMEREKLKEKLF